MKSAEFHELQVRYDEISGRLASEQLSTADRYALQKELSHLSDVLKLYQSSVELEKNISDAKAQLDQTLDPEIKQMFQEEKSWL